MEQMAGMVPGTIMGLASFIIGIAGFIWPAVNAEVFAKQHSEKIMDSLFKIQQEIDLVNMQMTNGFLSTFIFIDQENCFQKLHEPIHRILFSFKHMTRYLKVKLLSPDSKNLERLQNNF